MKDSLLDKKLEVEITGLTHEGKGVGRIDGKVVFVTEALPGEKVLCKVIKDRKSFLEGDLLEVIKSNPKRIKPGCEVIGDCGGCQLQHAQYQEQLRLKTNLVDDALQRIGNLSGYELQDTIGMEQPWGYRNKVVFQVGKVNGRIKLGFFKQKSKELVPYTKCALLDENVQKVAEDVESLLNKIDQIDAKVARILLRRSLKSGEMLLGFITTTATPNLNDIAKKLIEKYSDLKSIVQNFVDNSSEPWGSKTVLLAGREYITEQLKDITYRISAASFFQINSLQAETLYEKVLQFSEIKGNEIVWDLYCGTGSISLFLAKDSRHVYGIESVKKAVEDAKENAKINDIANVTFLAGKAERESMKLIDKGIRPDVIVVDPPRKGCHKDVLRAIIETLPQRAVYVSCNPATLARDLKILTAGGYQVQEVQPVDMFPHTYHVECVIRIQRKKCL